MKLSFALIIAFIIILTATNRCGKINKHPIEAKWKVINEEGDLGTSNIGTLYEFKHDSMLVLTFGLFRGTKKYSISNDTLSIYDASGITNWIFKIEGDVMRLSNTAIKQLLFLEKQ